MIPLLEKAKAATLTSSERLLLNYISEHPKQVVHQNLQFICDTLFISNATIIRFCQKLGFRGFNEFKFELRSQLNHLQSNDIMNDTLFDRQLAIFKDNLNNLQLNEMESIYQMLQSHKTIYIYGSAMSSIPAHYLHSVLSSLDYNCIYVEWRHLLRGIAEYTDHDTLMIMITSHGATERYEDILLTLKANHTEIIFITDEENNSLKQLSNVYINTNEQGKMMHNVDYSYKLKSLIIVQTLIEMIYYRTDNRQQ